MDWIEWFKNRNGITTRNIVEPRPEKYSSISLRLVLFTRGSAYISSRDCQKLMSSPNNWIEVDTYESILEFDHFGKCHYRLAGKIIVNTSQIAIMHNVFDSDL